VIDLGVRQHEPAVIAAVRRRVNPRHIPVLATLGLLALMYGIGVINYPGLSNTQVTLNIFIDNAFLLVVAVGMTFVILTGGIDLSVGAVVALTTLIAASLLKAGWPPLLVLPLLLLMGTTLGLAMGSIIHFFQVQPFIATLAGMFFARGLCFLINEQSVPITNPTWVSTAEAEIRIQGFHLSMSAIVSLVVVLIGAYVLAYTRLGRNVYAVGGSAQSATLMGLPVARTKITVYAISGFCSALGGVLLSFYMLSGYSLHAQGMELDAIGAVVIGGTVLAGGSGYLFGTVLGVLVYGLIQTLITFDGRLSSWWTRIFIGVLLFAFILLQRVVTRRTKMGQK
jgi:simple sugar transport system permease protein